jgi:tyrosyl-tRNA synthetase
VTTAAGTKFGKTEAGAVWLDPSMTSPYKFYQFWINSDDRDVGKYLRYFTLLARDQVETLDRALAERPETREAQRALATDVTARVHGTDAARVAEDASKFVFDRNADPREFTAAVLDTLASELPSATISLNGASAGSVASVTSGSDGATSTTIPVKQAGDGVGIDVLDAFVICGLVKSKGDARRLLQQGGLSVNGAKLTPESSVLPVSDALHRQFFVLRKGGRDIGIVRLSS